MTRLTIVNGPHRGKRLGLTATDIVIGREAECDLVLAHDWVSRRHCRLCQHGEGWQLEDLGSCNGVCLNGVRVEGTVPLASGDLIAIGPMILRFEIGRHSGRGAAGTPEDAEGADDAAAPAEAAAEEAASPEVEPIRVALAPDVRFAVSLAAVLQSQDEITHHGKVPLRTLARRGELAADGPFDGRLSGRFNRRQFLTLDAYDLSGQVSCTLRVGLLLPKRTYRRRREWVDAYVQCRIEHPVSIHGTAGVSVLDTASTQAHLGHPTRTISATEGEPDPAATGRLTGWSGAPDHKLPYDVTPEALSDRLTELCTSYVASERGVDASSLDLTEIMRQHCLEAAEMYRAWYRKRWHETTRSHDSQLPVGELRYEFDVQGKPVGQAEARMLTSVYRWV